MDRLRKLLVARAKAGQLITYGEVADHFGYAKHQGTFAALATALNALGRENKSAGEPQLMALVVNKSSGMPGPGFFETMPALHGNDTSRARLFAMERDRVFTFDWR